MSTSERKPDKPADEADEKQEPAGLIDPRDLIDADGSGPPILKPDESPGQMPSGERDKREKDQGESRSS